MDAPRFTVREVDGKDDEVAELLCELNDACFGDSAPQVDPSEGFWWIAYDAQREPAGFAGLKPSEGAFNAGYLSRSGVLPLHRGHGLQLRLIRAREQKAKRLGWKLLRSDTSDNPNSANNLIRAGFRMFDPEPPWGFRHTCYWRKTL